LLFLNRYDYIEVYDGIEELSDKMGKFCGTTKPSPFVSTGNELLLKFRSDDTVNWKGFHAMYKLVDLYSEESIAPTQVSSNHMLVSAKNKSETEDADTHNNADSAASATDTSQDGPVQTAQASVLVPQSPLSNRANVVNRRQYLRQLRRNNRLRQQSQSQAK